MKLTKQDIKTIKDNFVNLVESASLAIVSAYTFYGAFHYVHTEWTKVVLTFSASVISLIAATQFLKHLARK